MKRVQMQVLGRVITTGWAGLNRTKPQYTEPHTNTVTQTQTLGEGREVHSPGTLSHGTLPKHSSAGLVGSHSRLMSGKRPIWLM